MTGRILACVLFLLVFAKAAASVVGVPLIVLFLSALWLGLPFAIIVEALINSRLLSVSLSSALAPAALGNVLSMMIAVPLLWAVVVLLQLMFPRIGVPFPAIGWLLPQERGLSWAIATALLVFAVPCYLLSVLVEAPINGRALPHIRPRPIWEATAVSNLCGYLVLALLACVAFAMEDRLAGLYALFLPVGDWIAELTLWFGPRRM